MVDWAGDEEKVSPASRVFESTCAESRLPCHFKRAKGHPAKLSSMVQASGQSAIRLENVLFCADVAARCWTLDTEHSTCWTKRGSLRSSPQDDQANRRQKRKKKKKKKQTRKACLAGGCRLPSPPRRQPRPRTPFPTQLPFWFPAGRCWIIGSHDRRDGVSLGWLWRGRRRRSRLGRSEFVPPRRTAERTRANFAIAELDLLSRTGPHILCLSVGCPRCVTGAVHPRPRSRSTRG